MSIKTMITSVKEHKKNAKIYQNFDFIGANEINFYYVFLKIDNKGFFLLPRMCTEFHGKLGLKAGE